VTCKKKFPRKKKEKKIVNDVGVERNAKPQNSPNNKMLVLNGVYSSNEVLRWKGNKFPGLQVPCPCPCLCLSRPRNQSTRLSNVGTFLKISDVRDKLYQTRRRVSNPSSPQDLRVFGHKRRTDASKSRNHPRHRQKQVKSSKSHHTIQALQTTPLGKLLSIPTLQ
jgi:hypothetical protein